MTVYVFPGQGSQRIGMGNELFVLYPELVQQANDILGYSVKELCLNDPLSQLNTTSFTQPALYVVNALSYLQKLTDNGGQKPDYILGHSLGEYNALWASGVFDFATGLTLVQKRGSLMNQASGGGMAAVIGLSSKDVSLLLEKHHLNELTIANFNSYLQQVLSGPKSLLEEAKPLFIESGAQLYLPLAVNGAFHSGAMNPARVEFSHYLASFTFSTPKIPVIANLTALPYVDDAIKHNLSLQIDHPVNWLQSIRYLLLHGESDFLEVGPGTVLKNLVNRIIDGQ
jgi:malonyl CoA-acyl carrier protein transacylase